VGSDAIRWDTGCSWFDYDLDGKLDLVVTGYLEFDRSRVPEPGSSGYCTWKGIPVMCGPRGLPFTRTPRVRYVVAICARQVRDTRWGVDNDALVTGADVSRMVHDAFDRP